MVCQKKALTCSFLVLFLYSLQYKGWKGLQTFCRHDSLWLMFFARHCFQPAGCCLGWLTCKAAAFVWMGEHEAQMVKSFERPAYHCKSSLAQSGQSQRNALAKSVFTDDEELQRGTWSQLFAATALAHAGLSFLLQVWLQAGPAEPRDPINPADP